MTQSYRPRSRGPVELPPLGFLPANAPDYLLPRPRKAAILLALVSWLIICAIVTLFAAQPFLKSPETEAAGQQSLNVYVMRSQGRLLLGTREIATDPTPGSDEQRLQQVRANYNTGSVAQRLRFVVLAGEFGSPAVALEELDHLDQLIARLKPKLSEEDETERRILRKLYADYARLRYDAPSVTASERQYLRDHMDWFGQLALAPAGRPDERDLVAAVAGGPAAAGLEPNEPDPAARAALLADSQFLAWFMIGFVGLVFGAGAMGLLGLLAFVILAALRQLRGGLVCGVSPAGVYAETFALWLLAFVGLGPLARLIPLGPFQLAGAGVVELCSLLVLLWPVIRGVPLRRMLQDVGLVPGRLPPAEPVAGVACYCMSLPLVGVAFLVFLGIQALEQSYGGGTPAHDTFDTPMSPSHPIVLELARGSWAARLQLFFLASVVAPIVEETMFRGVLYRHLREATHRLGRFLSVSFSALLSSVIFAIIHPQGLAFSVVLMALAMGFCLAREWRITLLPGMVGHGLNNGLVLLLNIVLLGS
jgi:membrane protease YdiL (CAAX protease family)